MESVKKRKPLFSKYEAISIDIEVPWKISHLPALAQTIWSSVSELRTLGDELKNKNGRDPNHELFYIQGTLPSDEKDCDKKQGSLLEGVLSTSFVRFDRGALIEKISEHKIGDWPEWLTLEGIFKIAPFFPDEVRFGIQFFEETKISSLLGVAPKMIAYFYLEADETVCKVKIKDELRNPGELFHSKATTGKILDAVCRTQNIQLTY